MTIRHVFSNPVADGAATTVVRPSDWNSAHVQAMTLSGNTAGVSEISGHNIVLQGGSNVTLSGAMAGTMASLVILAGGGSAAQFALVDSNGISFGTNGSQVTASYTVPSVPAQSVQTQNLVSLLGSTGNISLANGNGISFGGNASTITASHNGLTTARASNDAVGLNTALTANGVSWTVNSAGLSLNVPAFLTTAAQSGHSHGNPTLALTNLSGTTASASNGLTLSLSAAAPGGGGGAALSAGTQSVSTGTVAFANSNGITFGMSGSNQITASHNGLTTAMQSGASANFAATGFTTTSAAGAVIAGTHDTAGLKLAVPAFLTTAQAPGAYLTTARASNDAVGLNTALTANGVSWTVNSSGLSLNVPAFLTTAAQSGHSHGNPTLALTNLSGTTASASNGLTLSLSAAAPGAAAEANWMTLGGNVLGNSSASGSTIQIIGGNNITVSGLNNSQIRIDGDGGGGAGYTALSIQNRQLGASTTLNSGGGQNSLWLSPLRVGVAVSASTLLAEMISYSGTITSAATAQAGQTIRAGIWSQLTDPASTTRFDTWWTGAASLTFWNSGTSSVPYAYSQSGGQTTGSSAGSNLMTASVMGARHILFPIGSTMPAGLYVIGVLNSSSSAGYSAAMSRMAAYFDNPLSVGQGTFGQATNNSIGYADGGTYLTTTGGLPGTLALNQIGGVANVMPFFKIGAI